jgi:tetratricopeptide (TPR) repeat protein
MLRDEYDAPAPALLTAREMVADAQWRRGHHEQAGAAYTELLEGNVTDAQGRRLEVKLIGLRSGGDARRAIYTLLVGGEAGPATPAVAVSLAADLDATLSGGLGAYLGARQLFAAQRYELALARLERARARGLATARLRREAARLRAISLFGLRRWDDATNAFTQLQAMDDVRPALAHTCALWLERIEHARQ